MAKEITIRVHHRGRETDYTGTVDHLAHKVFGYTLECGNSWNSKINMNPKTAKGLLKALEQSVQETQGGCFEQDWYELVSV